MSAKAMFRTSIRWRRRKSSSRFSISLSKKTTKEQLTPAASEGSMTSKSSFSSADMREEGTGRRMERERAKGKGLNQRKK